MPKRLPPKPPSSRDLIPAGPRHVQVNHREKHGQSGLKPSTSRALVLRNGKYGARGTGELVLAGRMTGREKLDLLAEDLVQKSRTALMAPLKLDKCINIADSQYNAYLDDIADLKDSSSFHDKIIAELIARSPYTSNDSPQHIRDAAHVASVISTRIHNVYMIASGWKLVIDMLRDLQRLGLSDATARTQLQSNGNLRSQYLALCDIVGILVDLAQAHFSILAMTTPHYSRYFKEVENLQPGEPSVGFDWVGLKDACKSFLDSIIIELCFPRSPYPRRILYHILHDAVDESPKEAKRFPQSMWDAVGDLSVSLELQELLDSPLLDPQGKKLRTLPRQMPEQYESWLDAQIYSRQASELYVNFKDIIDPLERTKDPSALEDMWKFINRNYKAISGLPVDSLWRLDEALHRTPQWSSFYMPTLRTYESDSDGEQPSIPLLKSAGQKGAGGKKKPKKLLAITDGRGGDDSNGSMPELQSLSDSSDEDDEDVFPFENDEDGSGDDTGDESDYGSEDEEAYRSMLREAMDTAMAIPEFFDPRSTVPEFNALAEERKGNPFLKLLGSLRGRMFSSDPKLSSTTRTEPRKGFLGQRGQTARTPAKQTTAPVPPTKTAAVADSKVHPVRPAPTRESPLASTLDDPRGYQPTVEDAEDEEDASSVASKKKKRPKKKKKKKATNELPAVQEDSVPVIPTPPENPLPTTLAQTPAKVPSIKPPISGAISSSLARMSTSSLPIEPTVAQSAHSYLQDAGAPKEKVKSRPDHASLFSEKRSLLSKLSSKEKTRKEDGSDPATNKTFTWFTNLGKKTAGYMHQLMRINADEKAGSLKWDNFVKVMREMGFKYDPSTAGSSVRFDPPNPGDRSITFHKPHPDPTLHASKVREFGRKLRDYYGWSEEDFLRRTNTL